MLSKKLVLIALSAVILSACQAIGSGEDSASNINRVRGKRGMTISDAEARQQRRQRVSELEESATRHTPHAHPHEHGNHARRYRNGSRRYQPDSTNPQHFLRFHICQTVTEFSVTVFVLQKQPALHVPKCRLLFE